ncbi:MAG: hypothetical protein JKY77_04745 [Rhizobiaceae bacterium]|nr:hypothetical protein [Rhizobiaceae bacterium]
MRRIFATLLFLMLANPALAAETLVIQKLNPAKYPKEIIVDQRKPAIKGLPDGKIATARGNIVAAWYSEPTQRYRHGVLGDTIEAGSLKVLTKLGHTLTYRLPSTEVFEDITPRLIDLDRNGSVEVVTIRSSLRKGAAITIYGLNGNTLVPKATTPYIGLKHRWLNIAGISNFSRSKNLEIAAVITPHIGGKLRFYQYISGKLVKTAAASGFSNHVIGSREQNLSAIADFDGNGTPDLALPSANRRSLYIISMSGLKMRLLAQADFPAKIDKAIIAEGKGKKTRFIVGLEDGSVYSAHR